MRAYKVFTANTTALIATSDAKLYLKVDISDDDTIIAGLVTAATKSAEEYTNRFFLETTLEQYGTTFDDIKNLFKSPTSQVVSIQYYDENNSLQSLSTDVYDITSAVEPSQIYLKPNQSFPQIAKREDAVVVKYKVGYGTASTDVPLPIIQACYLTIGHWYQNRQQVVVGKIATEIPMGAKFLLDQYKVQVCR